MLAIVFQVAYCANKLNHTSYMFAIWVMLTLFIRFCLWLFFKPVRDETLLCHREFGWWTKHYNCNDLLYHMVQDFIHHQLVLVHHENMWASTIVSTPLLFGLLTMIVQYGVFVVADLQISMLSWWSTATWQTNSDKAAGLGPHCCIVFYFKRWKVVAGVDSKNHIIYCTWIDAVYIYMSIYDFPYIAGREFVLLSWYLQATKWFFLHPHQGT